MMLGEAIQDMKILQKSYRDFQKTPQQTFQRVGKRNEKDSLANGTSLSWEFRGPEMSDMNRD